ncbi:MAG: fumarylacetoacetate hydrolase family protein [Anaerolineales bacterium]|nr:fumarylacetoacetate hydrolase family protein [Anaerolineales bacterium]
MKLVTYKQNGRISIGIVQQNNIIDISSYAPDMLGLIERGLDELNPQALNDADAISTLDDVELLAPIPNPKRNIMCLGLNYAEHVRESYEARGRQSELPQYPVIFNKATTSVNGPYADIPYDTAVSTEIDWEAELAIVIGRTGKNISASDAMQYIFGYTILNDMTARDMQKNGKQYFKGKSLDGHCPMGPWILTADAFTYPGKNRITSRVNGVTKQAGSIDFMIFDIPAIIAYLSKGMTLLPGDIIATGTPSGVGFARTPPEFLKPGDIVECEIEGVGIIRNRIASS